MNVYFTFANLTCRISGPKKQIAYITKCYKKSPYVRYIASKLRQGQRVEAVLRISVKKSPHTLDFFSLESDSSNMHFVLRCTDNIFFLFPIVEQVFRKIFYLLFFRSGGLILHASSVVIGGKAYIFCGPSGVGKSTIAMKLVHEKAGQLLADNNVYLRLENGKILLYPPPFLEWNFVNETVKYHERNFPVASILFLEKSNKTYKKNMSTSKLLHRLLHQIQFPRKSLTSSEIAYCRSEVIKIAMELMVKGQLAVLCSTKNGTVGSVILS